MTVTSAAKESQVSRVTLSKVLNGNSRITAQMALRLSAWLGTSPDIWMGIQTQKEAFEAADAGQWAAFLQVMGGTTPKRKELPIQLAKIESDEKGRYGDPIGNKTIGVQSGDIILKTRIHVWHFMTLPKQSPSQFNNQSIHGAAIAGITGAAQPHTQFRNATPLEFCQ